MTTYRRYTTGTKIRFITQSLSTHILRAIPRSTRHEWKSLSLSSFWMPTDNPELWDDERIDLIKAIEENKRIRSMLRLAAYLLTVYKTLLQQFTIQRQHALSVYRIIRIASGYCKDCLHASLFWKTMPFTRKQWKAWTSKPVCPRSLIQLCRKTHPLQVPATEQQIICDLCCDKQFETWPLSGIYYYLLREQKINCCLSTFYKYCRLMNITRKKVKRQTTHQPLIASAPLKMLHMDVTLFRTMNGIRHYIYVIRDNFSRNILAAKAALVKDSKTALSILKEVLCKHDLVQKEGMLITDDGCENKGAVNQWMEKSGTLWKHLVAQVDIVQSNSMVEAANKILKYRYLFPRPVADTEMLNEMLSTAISEYNRIPQHSLHGLSPEEVLNGMIPDKDRFKIQIASARQVWEQLNKNFRCSTGCKT